MPQPDPPSLDRDRDAVELLRQAADDIRAELARRIVGQREVIDQLLAALFCRGHCLMQGVPGLAKTMMIETLAHCTDLSFSRIQFTPDLMPADITGTDILQEDESGRRKLEFSPGPVFAHLLLADEINRAPPKTQAALLQAMAERHVTAGRATLPLPEPFFVLATQNPIEQEGTYPLPEAQLDRFMFMIVVKYPSRDDELEILKRTTGESPAATRKVLSAAEVMRLSELVRRVPVSEQVYQFTLDLVRATRPDQPNASDFVRQWLSWGAGPRAGQCLLLAGKARAVLDGRLFVTTDDIAAAAPSVLRHRLLPSFNAHAEGVTVDQIIDKLLTQIPPTGSRRLL